MPADESRYNLHRSIAPENIHGFAIDIPAFSCISGGTCACAPFRLLTTPGMEEIGPRPLPASCGTCASCTSSGTAAETDFRRRRWSAGGQWRSCRRILYLYHPEQPDNPRRVNNE